jgi:hypothetical protein
VRDEEDCGNLSGAEKRVESGGERERGIVKNIKGKGKN